jgi:uridylate kinase
MEDYLMPGYKYKRVLLKLSGEAISGDGSIINFEFLDDIAKTIVSLSNDGVEIGVIIGAGNIWRGRSSGEMDRSTADSMGMLGTIINALAAKDAVIRAGGKALVMTSTFMEPYAKRYSADEARAALSAGNIVFFAGGTGNPYFSTDTGAVLRGVEIEADAILMAKNVDGIYSADPNADPTAVKFDCLTYDEALSRHLKATDSTAMTLAMDNHMTLVCFALKDPENILRVVQGEKIGTIVKEEL